MRKKTKEIKIGNLKIGNNNPIAIQSMCNTDTKDANATINQIHRLEEAGCEIVRVSVPDKKSLFALREIKDNITIPLVADIHFDYKIGIEAANIADKIRINPGTIGSQENLGSIIYAAKNAGIPVRLGINLASLEKDIEAKYGLTPEAMVESAKRAINSIEDLNFFDMVIALKASDTLKTIRANALFSKSFDYPLHIGITEAGTAYSGTIKSSIGIGTLLLSGIGDTIRVSLSADPIEEVKVAWEILKTLKLRRRGLEITSCPTCSRANIDVIQISKHLENLNIKKPLYVAVMGCGVNGPGEAKETDIGVVGGKDKCLIYKDGNIIDRVNKDEILDRLIREIT